MSVFITGASAGIGEACARAFAAAKQDLVLVARRVDRLEALRKELSGAHGVRVDAFELDVQDRAGIDALIQQQGDVLSRADVLIHNDASPLGREAIQDGTPEDWDVITDTHL